MLIQAQLDSLFTMLSKGLAITRRPAWVSQTLLTRSEGDSNGINLTIFPKARECDEESGYTLDIKDWSDCDQSAKKIDELLAFLSKSTTIGGFRMLMEVGK